jgi:hypothetical protein
MVRNFQKVLRLFVLGGIFVSCSCFASEDFSQELHRGGGVGSPISQEEILSQSPSQQLQGENSGDQDNQKNLEKQVGELSKKTKFLMRENSKRKAFWRRMKYMGMGIFLGVAGKMLWDLSGSYRGGGYEKNDTGFFEEGLSTFLSQLTQEQIKPILSRFIELYYGGNQTQSEEIPGGRAFDLEAGLEG